MTIATGVFKKFVAKKQSALGTKATAGSAQEYGRLQSTLSLKKEAYASNEILTTQQVRDYRHGLKSGDGTFSSDLMVGTHQALMESVFRAAATAAVTTGAIITVTAAVTSGFAGTFTRSSGSYVTDGFRIGMVVRWTGWATTGVPNNSHNFLITALDATVMTVMAPDEVAIGAKAAGDTVTCTSVGKHLSLAIASHTRDYWTLEHNHTDIAQAEQFTDSVFTAMNVTLPATGLASIEFPIMALNMDRSTSGYFTSPTAPSSGSKLTANNGVLLVAGLVVGNITSFQYSVDGSFSKIGGVVGKDVDPDILPGVMRVTGSMTVLFEDAVARNYFVDETEVSAIAVFLADTTAASGVQSHIFPRIKFGGADIDDGEKALTLTMPFTALENYGAATGTFPTTVVVQDSGMV